MERKNKFPSRKHTLLESFHFALVSKVERKSKEKIPSCGFVLPKPCRRQAKIISSTRRNPFISSAATRRETHKLACHQMSHHHGCHSFRNNHGRCHTLVMAELQLSLGCPRDWDMNKEQLGAGNRTRKRARISNTIKCRIIYSIVSKSLLGTTFYNWQESRRRLRKKLPRIAMSVQTSGAAIAGQHKIWEQTAGFQKRTKASSELEMDKSFGRYVHPMMLYSMQSNKWLFFQETPWYRKY